MPLVTKPFDISPGIQEHGDEELLIYLPLVSFNGAKPIRVLELAGGPQDDGGYRSYHTAMRLTTATGDVLSGVTHVAIGASRIAGLVTHGYGHGRAIEPEAGTMSAFSVPLKGIALACAPTNWRGKPKKVQVRGVESDEFHMEFGDFVAHTTESGKTSRTTFQGVIDELDRRGVMILQLRGQELVPH
jgi:hypothetical protein